MKFIKLTELIHRYFMMYEKRYGKEALIGYMEGYLRGMKRIKHDTN